MPQQHTLMDGFSKTYILTVILIFLGVILGNFIYKSRLLVIARGTSLIVGICTGLLSMFYKPFQEYTKFYMDLNPKYYLSVMYSIQLFNDMIYFDSYMFVNAWTQMALMTTTIFLITSLVTGFFVTYSLLDVKVNIPLAVIYGAIVAHINTFEINVHLESIPRMRHLQALFRGESIINEPIMMIIFTVAMISHETNQKRHLDYFLMLLQLLCGGIGVGLVLGWFLALMMKKFTIDTSRLILYTLLWSFMGYHICSELGVSAPIAIITIGWFAMCEKERLGTYAANQLMNFWDISLKLIFYILFCLAGINLIEKVVINFEASDALIILVTFLTVWCSRIMALLIMAPILNRIGSGLTTQEAFVIALCSSRGGSSLFLAWEMAISNDKTISYLGKHLFINVCCLICLTSFVSLCLHPWLFQVLGIHSITSARRNNMNTCMKYINGKTEQFVSVLKMDKFLGDAKWPLVYKICQLRHPYEKITKSKVSDKEDEIHDKEIRIVICPECFNQIQQPPSAVELVEMMWECRMRILKSRKVSYSRQYENGTLMINAFRTLNNATETAMSTPEAIIKLDELFKMFKLHQETSSRKKRQHLRWLNIYQNELKPPKTKCRRLCFKLMTHPCFDIVIYAIILINSSLILYSEIKSISNYSSEWYIIASIDFVFLLIYVAEFIIKILGYSVRTICPEGFSMYFMCLWNIGDFIILLVVFLHTSYELCFMFSSCFNTIYSDKLKTAFFFLRSVRLLRLIKIIGVAIQKLKNYKINRINNRIMLAYEIGKGYVAGDEELEEMIHLSVENEKIRDDCLGRIKADRLAVTRQLGLVQKDIPWIANTVKTKQACMVVLSSMKDVITEFKTSGWIDEYEYRKLTNSVIQKISYVEQIKSIIQNTPKELFRETTWIGGDKQLSTYLFQNVITKIFDVGDIICQEGEHSNGVYIVISGLLRLSYHPNQKTLDEMRHFGKLPIVDFINNISYTERFDEYLTSGNTFGELSVLTGRQYDCSIYADTPVQTYVLSRGVLQTAFTLFYDSANGLESRMWKTVAVRIGPMILSNVQIFQSLSKSAIQYLLAESFVPDIHHYKILIMPNMIEDILLIDGIAQDYHTNYHFKAPCFIPRNVQKLVLPRSSHFSFKTSIQPKLLLIPGGEVSLKDIMEEIDYHSEMTPSAANMNVSYGANNLKWAHYKRQKESRTNARKKRLTDPEQTSSKQTVDNTLKQAVSFSVLQEQFSDSTELFEN